MEPTWTVNMQQLELINKIGSFEQFINTNLPHLPLAAFDMGYIICISTKIPMISWKIFYNYD